MTPKLAIITAVLAFASGATVGFIWGYFFARGAL